jgi:hypothetical protein
LAYRRLPSLTKIHTGQLSISRRPLRIGKRAATCVLA